MSSSTPLQKTPERKTLLRKTPERKTPVRKTPERKTPDQSLISATSLKARIAGFLGGRAAEQIVFGTDQVTSSAAHTSRGSTPLRQKNTLRANKKPLRMKKKPLRVKKNLGPPWPFFCGESRADFSGVPPGYFNLAACLPAWPVFSGAWFRSTDLWVMSPTR